MKNIKLLAAFLTLLAFAGCEYDNYDEPNVTLNGAITYKGQPLSLGYASSSNQMELWENGYKAPKSVKVWIKQDGTYNAKIFKGTYNLVLLQNVGPWVNMDTIKNISITGNKKMDIEVRPYYLIKNVKYEIKDSVITATCEVTKEVTDANERAIEYISLFVNTTAIVDLKSKIVEKKASGNQPGSVTITLNAKTEPKLKFLGYNKDHYIRLGVKPMSCAEALFSPVEKIQIK